MLGWNEQDDYKTSTLSGGDQGDSDGTASNASFFRPVAIAVDSERQMLYVADKGNHRIRQLILGSTNSSSFATTLAGSSRGYADGVGVAASFNEPTGIAIDAYSRLLFVADSANYAVREIQLETGRVTTLAGAPGVPGFVNGRGEAARFSYPTGLALALRSRQLFVCDPYNHAVRVVHVVSREVHTVAGSAVEGEADGTGAAATFHHPQASVVGDDEALVYVADGSPRIRALRTVVVPTYPTAGAVADTDAFSTQVTTVLDGAPLGLRGVGALALAHGWPGGALILADSQGNKVYRFGLGQAVVGGDDSGGGTAETSAGDNSTAVADSGDATSVSGRRLLLPTSPSTIRRLQNSEALTDVNVACPQHVPDFAGAGEQCHPRLALLAGSTPGYLDGMGINTRFYRPTGLAVEYLTRALYVADSYNHRIRYVDLKDIPDEIAVVTEEWYELIGRALQQNFVFILIVIGSTLILCCFAYLCCRFCSLCPLYQRRLHRKRMIRMQIGSRA